MSSSGIVIFRARGYRLLEDGVRVLDIEMDRYRRSP